MKILHVIATADPRSGGPIEGVLSSCALLEARSHSRRLVTLDSPTDPWVQSCSVPVFALGSHDSASRKRLNWIPWIHYGYTRLMVPWLKAHANEYDVIVINGLWNYCALAARIALRDSKTPYFVFTHGMLDPWFRRTYPFKSILKQILWWFSEGPLLKGASGVLFTAEEERVLARNAFWPYRAKEIVVGYGTTDVSGDPKTQEQIFRANVPNLGDRHYLLYLSRIHPKKGCDLLIKAFAVLASQNPNIHLVVCGPDQTGWVPTLQQLAEQLGVADRIHWPGMLSGDAKWGAFRACDAFVLPSHQENFGIVVAEALACGKPTLITSKVNIWREIKESGAGLIAEDSQDGIISLLLQFNGMPPEARLTMSRAARETFLKNFDISQNVTQLLDVFGEALAHDPA